MFGQLQSFPRALLGGVVIGIINRLVLANKGKGFLDDWGIGNGSNLLAIFLILLVLMLFINRGNKTSEQSWVLTPRLRSAHKDLVQYPLFKWVSRIGIVILALTIIGLPWVVDKPSRLIAFAGVMIVMLVVLSAVVLTGWAGQLSLGQYAFVDSWGIYDVVLYGVIELFSCSRYWCFVGNSRSPHCWSTSVADTWLISGIATLGFSLVAGRWILSIDKLNTNAAGGSKSETPVIFGRYDLRTDKKPIIIYACCCRRCDLPPLAS